MELGAENGLLRYLRKYPNAKLKGFKEGAVHESGHFLYFCLFPVHFLSPIFVKRFILVMLTFELLYHVCCIGLYRVYMQVLVCFFLKKIQSSTSECNPKKKECLLGADAYLGFK